MARVEANRMAQCATLSIEKFHIMVNSVDRWGDEKWGVALPGAACKKHIAARQSHTRRIITRRWHIRVAGPAVRCWVECVNVVVSTPLDEGVPIVRLPTGSHEPPVGEKTVSATEEIAIHYLRSSSHPAHVCIP